VAELRKLRRKKRNTATNRIIDANNNENQDGTKRNSSTNLIIEAGDNKKTSGDNENWDETQQPPALSTSTQRRRRRTSRRNDKNWDKIKINAATNRIINVESTPTTTKIAAEKRKSRQKRETQQPSRC